jgi:hypothetical protein
MNGRNYVKRLMFAACLLLLVAGVQASGWVDNGNGTWSLSLTVTVGTTIKNKAEQCRKWDNYRWRYLGQELDASGWLGGILTGTASREGGVVHNYLRVLWNRFVSEWVSRNSDTPDADGLAIVVPASPAAP